jgi:hypothetical protein
VQHLLSARMLSVQNWFGLGGTRVNVRRWLCHPGIAYTGFTHGPHKYKSCLVRTPAQDPQAVPIRGQPTHDHRPARSHASAQLFVLACHRVRRRQRLLCMWRIRRGNTVVRLLYIYPSTDFTVTATRHCSVPRGSWRGPLPPHSWCHTRAFGPWQSGRGPLRPAL